MAPKENPPVHIIKSIQDIFEVLTEENKERFITDLTVFILNTFEITQKVPGIKCESMEWTDDGIFEVTAVKINGKIIKPKK